MALTRQTLDSIGVFAQNRKTNNLRLQRLDTASFHSYSTNLSPRACILPPRRSSGPGMLIEPDFVWLIGCPRFSAEYPSCGLPIRVERCFKGNNDLSLATFDAENQHGIV